MITITTNRGGPDLTEALVSAMDAALTKALTDYRMAGFPAPFAKARDRYNHLFAAGENLALCSGLSVVYQDRLRPADIGRIDCVACLDAFTERTRP